MPSDPIKFACPNCAATLVAPPNYAGRAARCKQCHTVTTVPLHSEAEPSLSPVKIADYSAKPMKRSFNDVVIGRTPAQSLACAAVAGAMIIVVGLAVRSANASEALAGIPCLFLLLLPAIWIVVCSLPGKVAAERSHSSRDAVNLCGWLGVIFPPLFLIAIIWAHTQDRRHAAMPTPTPPPPHSPPP